MSTDTRSPDSTRSGYQLEGLLSISFLEHRFSSKADCAV